jgi:hypothetical protein
MLVADFLGEREFPGRGRCSRRSPGDVGSRCSGSAAAPGAGNRPSASGAGDIKRPPESALCPEIGRFHVASNICGGGRNARQAGKGRRPASPFHFPQEDGRAPPEALVSPCLIDSVIDLRRVNRHPPPILPTGNRLRHGSPASPRGAVHPPTPGSRRFPALRNSG